MLKSNAISSLSEKDNRNFFAQKNRSRQERSSPAIHEANRQAYQERKEQRRVLARTLDPIGFLEANGLVPKQAKKHFNIFPSGDVKREVARITYNAKAGCWLSCGLEEEPLGDNIALVRHLFGYSYLDAVDALLRHHGINDARSPALSVPAVLRAAAVASRDIEPAKYPVLPEQTGADVQAGRDYLVSRGIDMTTILKSERDGSVCYGQVRIKFGTREYVNQSVLFVGMDDGGDIRGITHRSVKNHYRGDIEASNKAFPCILTGDTFDHIVFVEGGISGLAAQSRARRAGELVPTIIVTGGGDITKFLDNNVVRSLLSEPALKRITLWFENETLSPKAIKRDAADTEEATVMALLEAKQKKSDAGHEKQIAGIEAISQVKVTRARPVGFRHKDVADVLIAEVTGAATGSIVGLVEITAAQNRDCSPERA